ncbi:MAG: hypothetical protein JO140_03925 [Candidatus Eremiobacteraeota bacterium]|nr:hypothetical protein [Candidatus Eremiobacteraeota bacterium]
MIQRYYFGDGGELGVRRFRWRLVLTAVWIVVSAFELVVTARSSRTHILSYFWAACLIFWVTMGSFGIRYLLERRRS